MCFFQPNILHEIRFFFSLEQKIRHRFSIYSNIDGFQCYNLHANIQNKKRDNKSLSICLLFCFAFAISVSLTIIATIDR